MKGSIYTLGSNQNGRLGIGYKSTKFVNSPVLVSSLSKMTCLLLSTGFEHTVAIMGNIISEIKFKKKQTYF